MAKFWNHFLALETVHPDFMNTLFLEDPAERRQYAIDILRQEK
jgi:hypothetical protein